MVEFVLRLVAQCGEAVLFSTVGYMSVHTPQSFLFMRRGTFTNVFCFCFCVVGFGARRTEDSFDKRVPSTVPGRRLYFLPLKGIHLENLFSVIFFWGMYFSM